MSYDYPPEAPPKKPRGCLFYGCLFSVIALVLLIVLIGGATYFGYRYLVDTAKAYTDTAPVAMPAVAMPEPERAALHARVEAFGKDLEARTATEPIILTADDLNALIDDNPMFKGKAHVDIAGEKVTARISVPLSDWKLDFSDLKGRYVNGSAILRVSLKNGVLDVRADSVEVKGKPLPESFMKSLREKNLAEKSFDDPKARASLDKIESLVVKDGKIILTPRPPTKPAPAPEGEPPKDAPPKDAAEEPAKP